ncbi:MAG: hypothetical protein J5I50_11390 [Chitinophagaceae bacterium]|nr:hypothetical protein [Chitinophagaceae bacterium]
MEELIASFLAQKGECKLPFGDLILQKASAYADRPAQLMGGPEFNYVLQKGNGQMTRDFSVYIARYMNCTVEEAESKVASWANNAVEKIHNSGTIDIPSVGTLYENEAGKIQLRNATPQEFFPAVKAEFAVHEGEAHKMLVGDTESDTKEMHQLLHEAQNDNTGSRWWIAALILLFIAVVLYGFFYLTGNHPSYLNPENAPATYISK